MKVYYLRIPSSDFIKSPTAESAVWTSPVIDLYDNDYYKNYSITKSKYGLNLLGNQTWTGRQFTGDDTTDAGRIYDGRFIDTSTRVDVISHTSEISAISNTNATITWSMDYYYSPRSDGAFPDEWVSRKDFDAFEDILAYDTKRYAVFVINFKYTQYTEFDFDFLVRIEVDAPVSLMLWEEGKKVMSKFPQWMAMREYDYLSALLYRIDGATPETAVPNTAGSALINALIGEYLDEIDSDMQYLQWQRFIDTIDLTQVAWVYRADAAPRYLYSIQGDGVELTRAVSQREFEVDARDYDDVCWWDEVNQTVFTRRQYTELTLNGTVYPQRIHHVWNFLDDFGMALDLKRLRNESNESYHHRIKKVWNIRPGVFKDAYLSLLRRELGLWQESGGGGIKITNSGRSDSGTFVISPQQNAIDLSGNLDLILKISLEDWDRYTNFVQYQPLYNPESDFYDHENQPIIGQFHVLPFNAENWAEADRDFGWKLEINDKAEVVWHWYDIETETVQSEVLGVGDTSLNNLNPKTPYWIRIVHQVAQIIFEPLLDEFGNAVLGEDGNEILIATSGSSYVQSILDSLESPILDSYSNEILDSVSELTVISLLISEDGESWTEVDAYSFDWVSPIDGTNLPILLGGLSGITDKAWQNFSGVIHYVEIRNEIDGKPIVQANFEESSVAIPWSNATQGETGEYWFFSGNTEFASGISRVLEDVTILEMSDIETNSDYFSADGLPTQRFKDLINRIHSSYPITWGKFKFGHALWDAAGPDGSAFSYVPYALDATPPDPLNVQTGVGDGDDVFLYHPDIYTGPREFSYKFLVRGKKKSVRNEYRPVHLVLDIYGQGDYEVYDNAPVEVWLTVEVVSATDNATYYGSFQLTAVSDTSASNPTPSAASHANFSLFKPDGTLADIVYYRQNGTATSMVYAGANFRLDQISNITLKHGRYNPITHSYDELQSSDTFEAWFSNDDSTRLTYNSGAPSLSNNAATPTALPQVQVVMESKVTSYELITNGWHSEPMRLELDINGGIPGQIIQDTSIAAPDIAWDENVVEGTRSLVVQIVDTNEYNQHGGYTQDVDGNPLFLRDIDYLLLNNSSQWTGGHQSLLDSTTVLTFSTRDGLRYPVEAPYWEFFEQEQVTRPFDGVVDENGPWRSGVPAPENNLNWSLDWINLTREDFGLPSTSDYAVTWMGVTVDDSYVMVWVDNNLVKPATQSPPEPNFEYSATSIVEYLDSFDYATPFDDGGLYVYKPFRVYARVRPNPPAQWHPQLHTGWFYTQEDEYYSYARPRREIFESSVSAPTNEYVLEGPARQGAPIIVWTHEATPQEFRQVYFVKDYATPVITLTNTQTLPGNGTNNLYADFPDLYNVQVKNLTLNQVVVLTENSTLTNKIVLPYITDKTHLFEVSYRLRLSFYVDHDYVDEDGYNRTKLTFDINPTDIGVESYVIDYEDSIFNSATPIDLPLSPLYTSINEGFVFINFNEETLDKIFLKMSSSKLVADGKDYLQVTLNSVDQYGNPKPNQDFEIKSSFGYLQDPRSVLNSAEFYVDARQYLSSDGQVLRNLGTEGQKVNAYFGASTGLDSADPKFLHYGGTQYVYLPNVEGNYIQTEPFEVEESSEFDFRIRVALDNWSSSTDQVLAAQWGSSGDRSWKLTHNNRTLTYEVSVDGINAGITALSNSTLSSAIFGQNLTGWIRVVYKQDIGDGTYRVEFYEAEDSPIEPPIWVQVGTAIAGSSIGSWPTSTSDLTLGALMDGSVQAGGSFYYASLYNLANGLTPQLVFDPTLAVDPYISWTAADRTWTISRATDGVRHAVLVSRPVFILGVDDYFEIPDSLTANISNVLIRSNVATITTDAPHGFSAGNVVDIDGLTNTVLNGTWTIIAVPSTDTFTFEVESSNLPTAVDSGTATLDDFLDFSGTEAFTIIAVVRNYLNATEPRPIIQKKDEQSDTSPGYAVWIDDNTNRPTFTLGDGTYKTEASGISPLSDGHLQIITAVRNQIPDTICIYRNSEVGTATATVDLSIDPLANSLPLRIGGESGSGTNYGSFEFYAAALFRRALTEEEILHAIDEIHNTSRTVVTTDHDGRAAVYLTAADQAIDLVGTVAVEALTETVGYNIELDSTSFDSAASDILTFNHELGDGIDRMVLVGVNLESSNIEPLNSLISVTFGSIPMIRATSQHASNIRETSAHISWFYLCDKNLDAATPTQILPSAGTYPVVVSVTGRVAGSVQANCYSVFGAAQQAPEQISSSGTSNNVINYSETIETLTDKSWVFDLIHLASPADRLDHEPGQIHVIENIGSTSGAYSSVKFVRKAGLSRMGWTASATQARWAHSLISIRPSITTARISASMQFEIEPTTENGFSIVAVAGAETIPADSVSTNSVLGKVIDNRYQPVPSATVYWQKSRSLYELYNSPVHIPKRSNGIRFENKGDQVYTADSAALSMTAGLDLRVCVRCDDWYESSQAFVSKWLQTGNQRSYWFGLGDNPQRKLTYRFSTNGTMVVSTTASAPLPVTDGHIWLRVKHEPSSNPTVTFYYNIDNDPYTMPNSWTTLSAHSGVVGPAIHDSTATVSVGSDDGVSQLYGNVWRVQIRNNTDTVVSDLDFVNGWDHDPITSLTKRSIKDSSNAEWHVTNSAHFVPSPYYGVAYTDQDGVFVIRPFVSATPTQPGYWFVATHTENYGSPATPFDAVGDVTFWYEYPDIIYGYEPHQQGLRLPVQYATPVWDATPFLLDYALPSWYDEATPYAPATPAQFQWVPPKWYPIRRHQQYFMGLMGGKRSGQDSQYFGETSQIRPEIIHNLFPYWREV